MTETRSAKHRPPKREDHARLEVPARAEGAERTMRTEGIAAIERITLAKAPEHAEGIEGAEKAEGSETASGAEAPEKAERGRTEAGAEGAARGTRGTRAEGIAPIERATHAEGAEGTEKPERPMRPKRPKRGARPEKQPDSRPYIRDVSRKPQGAIDVATVTIGMVLLALAVGFVIGLAVFAVMNLSTWLTELLWNGAGGALGVAWFPLAACAVGGVLIGLWTWWSGDRVRPLEEVMAEFKATGSYKTDGVAKPVVTFLLPLVFGGSIGFEAGLTGLVTAGCCWIRDRLKAAGLRAGAVADVTIAASFAAIFGTPLAGIVAGAESAPADGEDVLAEPDVNDYNMRRGAKIVLYTAAAFGAFGGIGLFSHVFGTSGGLPRFEAITASYTELLWAIPCLVVAYAMALLYHGSARLFGGVSARLGSGMAGTVGAPVVAGVIMGAIACALPYVLFPGETQSEELMASWTAWAPAALLATGLLKAIVTPMCLNMGWIGGNFFPSIFAGVAAGYGLAAFTGADPMLMVTVTTTAFLAGVIRKPLLVLAILFLCFPVEGLIWMGLAAIVGAALPMPRILLERA